MKRGISLILAFVMVLGLFPATAFATEAEQVYISASHDGQFITDQNGDVLAYTAVSLDELASVNLDDYGLSDFAYDADGDGSYEITALHLYIYTHEVLCGGADCVVHSADHFCWGHVFGQSALKSHGAAGTCGMYAAVLPGV